MIDSRVMEKGKNSGMLNIKSDKAKDTNAV